MQSACPPLSQGREPACHHLLGRAEGILQEAGTGGDLGAPHNPTVPPVVATELHPGSWGRTAAPLQAKP